MRSLTLSTLLLPLLLTRLTIADATTGAVNLNPQGEGCIDPSTYLSCYQKNIDTASTCATLAQNNCGPSTSEINVCLQACYDAQLAANIGCWLTSCWNLAYSCAYQGTVLQYIAGADRIASKVSIPYFPAPATASEKCVCNLGQIYTAWSNYSLDYGDPCWHFTTTGVYDEASCACCYESSFVSTIYNQCPSNDLSYLEIDTILNALKFSYNDTNSQKCSVLSSSSQSTCSSRYGVVPPDLGEYEVTSLVNPGVLPSGFPGTAPLSDVGEAITKEPMGGNPYTFSVFPSYVSVITPAAYNAKNAAVGSGVVASALETGAVGVASGSSGGSVNVVAATAATAAGTGSGSGSGAAATGTANGGSTAGAAAATTTGASKSGAERVYVGRLGLGMSVVALVSVVLSLW